MVETTNWHELYQGANIGFNQSSLELVFKLSSSMHLDILAARLN